ncbi:PE family protein, partial [Mycobacterium kansasii]
MTSMIAQPQLMADAAANIEGIRSAIAAANAAAAGPTTGLAAGGPDAGWAPGAPRWGANSQPDPGGVTQAAGVDDPFSP